LSFPIIFNHAQHYQGNLKKKQGSPCNFSPPKRLGEKKKKTLVMEFVEPDKQKVFVEPVSASSEEDIFHLSLTLSVF
jgi:hypothetical protein